MVFGMSMCCMHMEISILLFALAFIATSFGTLDNWNILFSLLRTLRLSKNRISQSLSLALSQGIRSDLSIYFFLDSITHKSQAFSVDRSIDHSQMASIVLPLASTSPSAVADNRKVFIHFYSFHHLFFFASFEILIPVRVVEHDSLLLVFVKLVRIGGSCMPNVRGEKRRDFSFKSRVLVLILTK